MEYDEELQKYLKMTGLQASDLVKSKNRKKDTSKHTTPTPPPSQMAMASQALGLQHMGMQYQANAAGMMTPMGFPANMANMAGSYTPTCIVKYFYMYFLVFVLCLL